VLALGGQLGAALAVIAIFAHAVSIVGLGRVWALGDDLAVLLARMCDRLTFLLGIFNLLGLISFVNDFAHVKGHVIILALLFGGSRWGYNWKLFILNRVNRPHVLESGSRRNILGKCRWLDDLHLHDLHQWSLFRGEHELVKIQVAEGVL
jgi:hypothetical protein